MQEGNFRRDSLNLSQARDKCLPGTCSAPKQCKALQALLGLVVVFCPVCAVILSLPLWRFLILLLVVRTRSALLWVLPHLPGGAAPLWVFLQRWEAEHGPCHSLLLVQGGSAPLWVLLQRWKLSTCPAIPCSQITSDRAHGIGNRRFPGTWKGSQERLSRMELRWLLLPSSLLKQEQS